MNKLQEWFKSLNQEFPTSTPPVTKTAEIVKIVETRINTKIKQVIAKGDNGIVCVCQNGTILKFTIDENEAKLWSKIKGNNVPGLAEVYWVAQIFSPEQDTSIIYAINVAYIANDINQQQHDLINQARKSAYDQYSKYKGQSYTQNRTIKLVQEFEKIAEIDKSFQLIPELIINLADEYDSYIYDLHPGNFKVNDEGMVILIDPSVPDIFNVNNTMEQVVYEEFKYTCQVVLY